MPPRTCAEYRELISYYLDGEASPEERSQLMAHIATCGECRRTIDAYRSIGQGIRTLPPIHPPSDLTEAIYASTVDAAPRRLFLFTSRLGYSVSAIAAVLLIFVVAAYLLIGGYQRGVDPKVTASQPQNDVTWSIFKPIEITFNKPMDRESVEAALGILPTDPEKQLAITWHGNTLVIGENQSLKPSTSYVITISTAARDKWGNRLNQEFNLQFGTTSSVPIEEEPPPTLALTDPTEIPITPTVALESDAPTATPEVIASATPPPATPTAAATVATVPSGSASPSTGSGDGTPVTPTGSPPPEDTVEPATPTPLPGEIEPTATPTEVPPTATPTGVPPTATPTEPATATPQPTETPLSPTSTPEPTFTPTPDVIAVTGSFGALYWNDDTVQERLGTPISEAFTTDALDQPFQHGEGYYRADTDTIYLMNTDSFTWEQIPNTSTSLPDPQPGAEPDTWIPGGIIGFHWQAEQWIQDSFGYATSEYWSAFSANVQQFEHGIMLMAPGGQIYVLYDTTDWEFRSVGAS